MKKFILIKSLLFILSISTLIGQDIVGSWKTIDDRTGKVRSIVEIQKLEDKYYGKISKIFLEPHEDKNPRCISCEGSLKNKPIIGMQIINGLNKQGSEFIGEILDPEDGKKYKCKLWIEDNRLKVRGYVLFLYRTQTWLPANKEDIL